VLLVQNAILRSVCLNTLVIYNVFLPTCVKVAHLCLEVCVDCCRVILSGSYLCGVIGNELLCRMLCMILSSWRLCEFCLL